jgi:hypothetical protein
LVNRHQEGKNGSCNKVGSEKQVSQKAERSTEKQYASDAVDMEALHIK